MISKAHVLFKRKLHERLRTLGVPGYTSTIWGYVPGTALGAEVGTILGGVISWAETPDFLMANKEKIRERVVDLRNHLNYELDHCGLKQEDSSQEGEAQYKTKKLAYEEVSDFCEQVLGEIK